MCLRCIVKKSMLLSCMDNMIVFWKNVLTYTKGKNSTGIFTKPLTVLYLLLICEIQ